MQNQEAVVVVYIRWVLQIKKHERVLNEIGERSLRVIRSLCFKGVRCAAEEEEGFFVSHFFSSVNLK